MSDMIISNAQYIQDEGENTAIKATIDGIDWSVPICVGNSHYDEIMRQVAAGTLTIEDAD